MSSAPGAGTYQSMDCGGSSFELEVLTVSTQPVAEMPTSSVPELGGSQRTGPANRHARAGGRGGRTWDREFPLPLQECRVCVDEFLRLLHTRSCQLLRFASICQLVDLGFLVCARLAFLLYTARLCLETLLVLTSTSRTLTPPAMLVMVPLGLICVTT